MTWGGLSEQQKTLRWLRFDSQHNCPLGPTAIPSPPVTNALLKRAKWLGDSVRYCRKGSQARDAISSGLESDGPGSTFQVTSFFRPGWSLMDTYPRVLQYGCSS